MYKGKNLGRRVAASRTQRYPATKACEVRASMDWAREILGTSSSAKDVMPPAASARTVGNSEDGDPNPTVTEPGRRAPAVDGSMGRTWQ